MARWRGSESERFLQEHEGCFRWLALAVGVGLVVRFLAEFLGGAASAPGASPSGPWRSLRGVGAERIAQG